MDSFFIVVLINKVKKFNIRFFVSLALKKGESSSVDITKFIWYRWKKKVYVPHWGLWVPYIIQSQQLMFVLHLNLHYLSSLCYMSWNKGKIRQMLLMPKHDALQCVFIYLLNILNNHTPLPFKATLDNYHHEFKWLQQVATVLLYCKHYCFHIKV